MKACDLTALPHRIALPLPVPSQARPGQEACIRNPAAVELDGDLCKATYTVGENYAHFRIFMEPINRGLNISKIKFIIPSDRLFTFLREVSNKNDGPTCPICGDAHWAVVNLVSWEDDNSTSDSKKIKNTSCAPFGYTRKLAEEANETIESARAAANSFYSFMCFNCGYELHFSAGMVLAKLAGAPENA